MNIFKRPMFFAAVVCCVAAALSLYTKTLAFVFIAISLILFLIAVFNKKYQYITVVMAVLLFTINLSTQFIHIKNINQYNNQSVSGKFLVASEPQIYDEFYTVTLKSLKNDELPKNLKFLVFDYKKTKLKMGEVVSANIKISTIDRYDEYRLYDYSNGIYAVASIKKIEKTKDYNLIYKLAGNIRAYVKNTTSSHFSGDTSGLLLALTTGDKTLIGDDFSANVKTTGISHVLVVSGMHLSIIMAAVFWCFDRLFYNKYVRNILSVVFVVFIFTVCGFTMSITRAGSMFIIAGIAPVFNRDSDSLSCLLTAVTAVLIGAPFAIFNVSFGLSVLSTLAIIWVVPFYYSRIINGLNISSKFLKGIIGATLFSILALIFTLPITIKTFGFISVVSPLTNLLITYPVTIALILNIFALAIYAVPFIKFLGNVLLVITGLISKLIVFTVNTIAKLPITVAVLPKSAFWVSVLTIIAIIGYMYYYEYKKKRSDLNANSIRG